MNKDAASEVWNEEVAVKMYNEVIVAEMWNKVMFSVTSSPSAPRPTINIANENDDRASGNHKQQLFWWDLRSQSSSRYVCVVS